MNKLLLATLLTGIAGAQLWDLSVRESFLIKQKESIGQQSLKHSQTMDAPKKTHCETCD